LIRLNPNLEINPWWGFWGNFGWCVSKIRVGPAQLKFENNNKKGEEQAQPEFFAKFKRFKRVKDFVNHQENYRKNY